MTAPNRDAISDRFRGFASDLRKHADDPSLDAESGVFSYMRAAERGAKLAAIAEDKGCLTLAIEGQWRPTIRPGDDETKLWNLSWAGLCIYLAKAHPDEILADPQATTTRIISRGPDCKLVEHTKPAAHWRERARSYAGVLELLARLTSRTPYDNDVDGYYQTLSQISEINKSLRSKGQPELKPFDPEFTAGSPLDLALQKEDQRRSLLGLAIFPRRRVYGVKATQGEAVNDGKDAAIGFLGGTELADVLKIPKSRREAFFRQLERKRFDIGDANFQEVKEPRPNSPKFLYKADSQAVINLAAGYREERTA